MPVAVVALPALFADQGDEPDVSDILALVFVTVDPRDAHQLLSVRIGADGHDHTSTDRKLPHQRSGHIRRSSGDENCIEGGLVDPSFGAVGVENVDIIEAGRVEIVGGGFGELADALDGEHFACDFGENSRCIAGAGPDLEQLLAAAQSQRLDHERHDIGLRNGLSGADRKRPVFVGFVALVLRHEQLAANCPHGRKHQRIANAAGFDLPRNELLPQLFHVRHRAYSRSRLAPEAWPELLRDQHIFKMATDFDIGCLRQIARDFTDDLRANMI